MQQSNVGRLSTGRDSDKPGIPPPTPWREISLIPVALPPRAAGDGLTRSLFILCIVQYVVYLLWLV